MNKTLELLENCPIIAAVKDEKFAEALKSPAEIIFLLNANIMTVGEHIALAHNQRKKLFVHIDLAEGIGKDKAGITFLAENGVDGIISTRSALIRIAKEKNLSTVQRIFALDSQGVSGASEMLKASETEFAEIMPGVAYKVISKLAKTNVPIIAGGLIETKIEVMEALGAGAVAVSTGKKELWDV